LMCSALVGARCLQCSPSVFGVYRAVALVLATYTLRSALVVLVCASLLASRAHRASQGTTGIRGGAEKSTTFSAGVGNFKQRLGGWAVLQALGLSLILFSSLPQPARTLAHSPLSLPPASRRCRVRCVTFATNHHLPPLGTLLFSLFLLRYPGGFSLRASSTVSLSLSHAPASCCGPLLCCALLAIERAPHRASSPAFSCIQAAILAYGDMTIVTILMTTTTLAPHLLLQLSLVRQGVSRAMVLVSPCARGQ